MLHNNSPKLVKAIFDRQAHAASSTLFSLLKLYLAKVRYHFWSIITSSDIHFDATIGKGVKFPHPNGVVIHRSVVIGSNCMIMQQVTLGQTADSGAPTLGNGVYIGAGAKILGHITIGDEAKIGANAVVLRDVPAGATAVGVPAEIISKC